MYVHLEIRTIPDNLIKLLHHLMNICDTVYLLCIQKQQGVLMVNPTIAHGFNSGSLARLWLHESLRVFGDRLVNDTDRSWFMLHLDATVSAHLHAKLEDLLLHLNNNITTATSGTTKTSATTAITTTAASAATVMPTSVSYSTLRKLFFGDYMKDGLIASKSYEEIRDVDVLQSRMTSALADYNGRSRRPMNLVMFMFAVEHVSRLSRLLKMPGGNALLVGVGGSGRQSCTKLAVHLADQQLFQIEISKSYGKLEWREDLKAVLKAAGTGERPVTFLFSDAQIKAESFVEDLSNMLSSGEVPNLFAADEKLALCEVVRAHAKRAFGNKQASDMTQPQLYSYFVTRVRANLHVVLAFSPIGGAFRDRLRKYPSIVNCCAIDWFTAWPQDALQAVAHKFLSDIPFDNKAEGDATRLALVRACQLFHDDVTTLRYT
jgi:dynein heavy chain, axonemal